MGSGIACQLANVGMDVLMLDIVPFDLKEEEKSNPAARNKIVNEALKATLKSKPAALYSKKFASRIKTGNFEDDFDKISDADWIIEVVIERLDIKKQIFEKVEKFRRPGSLITSNTSSIPIQMLMEGRSQDFQEHFCGTHFFNPPRYLRLFEVIPHEGTKKEVLDFFMDFGDYNIGKQTVLCKDTPGFISNRIGVMSMTKLIRLTEKYNFTIEEVDSMTGAILNRPNTGTYRLQDLVGIDTGKKVSDFLMNNTKGDEFYASLEGSAEPKSLQFLLENKFYGNKSGQGYYQKTEQRDEKGKRIINALNLDTLVYTPSQKARLDIIKTAKSIELFDKRLASLLSGESKEHKFYQEYFSSLLAYSANRVPEISDEFFPIDDAMRAGYMWEHGPFELWDLIGFEKGIELLKQNDQKIPDWINNLGTTDFSSFYKFENGAKKYFNLASHSYQEIPGGKDFIILDALRTNSPIIENSEATVHDLGDGVMCLEFRSKSNSIGEGIGLALNEVINKAEDEGWKGIVIGNNAKNFTVGANLMPVGMLAMQKDFESLDKMVDGFQQLTMRCKTSKIPVVVATQGYVFGGGCEISMHCDAGAFAAESYIGLVEVGVGLIPGGGGTKEMALRASNKYFEGDVQIPTLIEHFKPIATATVATSAHEAFDLGLLDPLKDEVCLNTERNIAQAKAKVLELAEGYIPRSKRDDVTVLGRTGLSALYSAINEFRLGEYMSDYDVEIARKVAFIICGGDLTQSQKVSEQYLLDLEREAFLSLLGNQKTLDRIQHILMYNKPLRN